MWNLFKRSQKLIKIFFSFRRLSRSDDIDSQQRARHSLMQQFADARGVTMKVGQLFAAAGEAADELAPLIKSIEPLPLKKMLPVIEKSLGCSWKKVFKSIDESIAAASLGQVHHAVLQNGDEVAIKVQYPDIQMAIDAEMKLLGMMPKAGPVKQWSFDLDGYRHVLKDNMHNELDYRHEAQTQIFFLHHLNLPAVVVPFVYEHLSSEKLLVQSWEEGLYLDQTLNWPQQSREKIACTLLGLLLTSLFKTRQLHADPHMGNSYFRNKENTSSEIEMVLMDFGCTIELSEAQSLALLKLIISLREKTSGLPIRNFAAMGFDAEKLARIEPYLPRLCLYLFEPFLKDEVFRLNHWQVGEKITDFLAEKRWWFRSAGPAKLIFIMRAFQGFTQQLQMLNVDINWWKVLHEVLPEDLIEKARNYQCPVVGENESIKALANVLKVKVIKQGVTKVEVDLPAEAVLNLEQFIPAEIQLKLKKSSEIDLKEIIEKVRLSSLAAQTVFDYEDNNQRYQVWLE